MTADTSVRLARPDDTAAIGRLQRDGWRVAYERTLPAEVLTELRAEVFAEQWRAAIEDPPTPRHRVLVALAGETVVGFAALGPAIDPDRDQRGDGELHTLLVDPAATGRGHGSRLLAAAADHLRADGCTAAVTWLLTIDDPLTAFLGGAGWAPDGARRELCVAGDGSATLGQVRLHTDLTED